MRDTDLAIVGSGFGGSTSGHDRATSRVSRDAARAREASAVRDWRIGVAARGHSDRAASDRYDLPRVRPLSAFGTWQRTYPHVVCGLKRGFTYFKHEAGRAYKADEDRTNQLLVAASPSDELSDTHWLRSDVDQFLVNEAIALGVDYHDLVDLDGIEWQPIRGSAAARNATGSELPHPRAVCRRCVRAARISEQGARHRRSRLRRLSADAGIVLALHRRSSMRRTGGLSNPRIPDPDDPESRIPVRSRIRWTMPRCIMCSTADGCGCCDSEMA